MNNSLVILNEIKNIILYAYYLLLFYFRNKIKENEVN